MDSVEVFGVGPDGELIEIRSRADRAWVDGPLDDNGLDAGGGYGTDDSPRHTSHFVYQARQGQRPGGYGDRKSRSGGREDVMAPVPVLPGVASRALHDGDALRAPIPGLAVDLGSLEVDARGSSWKAEVACGRFPRRHRKATLRAYPSPSLNLTILELVPNRPRLIHTRAFVTAGVEAIDALSRRLTDGRGRRSTIG